VTPANGGMGEVRMGMEEWWRRGRSRWGGWVASKGDKVWCWVGDVRGDGVGGRREGGGIVGAKGEG